VAGQIDAAEGVQAQPAARALFGQSPEQDRRVHGAGQLERQRTIGERGLEEHQQIERPARQLRAGRLRRGRVHHRRLRADELAVRRLKCGARLAGHFGCQRGVKRRPGDGNKTDAQRLHESSVLSGHQLTFHASWR